MQLHAGERCSAGDIMLSGAEIKLANCETRDLMSVPSSESAFHKSNGSRRDVMLPLETLNSVRARCRRSKRSAPLSVRLEAGSYFQRLALLTLSDVSEICSA